MTRDYLLLDVFTETALSGNQLAVVMKADGLPDGQMQAIAREFNLSETVFLTNPERERNTAGVRIFTPQRELPFAGHPTIGTAVVLGLQRRLNAVRIEEKVGVVTAVVERHGKQRGHALFALPQLPEEVGKAPGTPLLAKALGLEPEDIGCGAYHPAVFSAGVTFYLVPVRTARALAAIEPQAAGWDEAFPLGHHSVYCFTEAQGEARIDLAARMFSLGLGVREDPGTGSAAAALIGLLARHASFDDGQVDYVLRQGDEMGRPCRIAVQLRKEAGVLKHGGIGGSAIVIGQGTLDI